MVALAAISQPLPLTGTFEAVPRCQGGAVRARLPAGLGQVSNQHHLEDQRDWAACASQVLDEEDPVHMD